MTADTPFLDGARAADPVALARLLVSIPSVNPVLTPGGAGEVRIAEVCAELGRLNEAREHVSQILRIDPAFSLEFVCKASFFKDQSHLERRLAALRKAGLD